MEVVFSGNAGLGRASEPARHVVFTVHHRHVRRVTIQGDGPGFWESNPVGGKWFKRGKYRAPVPPTANGPSKQGGDAHWAIRGSNACYGRNERDGRSVPLSAFARRP